jgi:hypothetical protein
MEEQRAKCDEASELKRRGNDLYQTGEIPRRKQGHMHGRPKLRAA